MTAFKPANSHCPWSGDPVSETASTLYRSRTVAFCKPGCRDKFERATQAFDAAIDAKDHGFDRQSLVADAKPYVRRLFQYMGVQDLGGGTFKLYMIDLDPDAGLVDPPDAAALSYATTFSGQRLSDAPIGFIILHKGEEGDWLLLHWWAPGGILHNHVAHRADTGAPYAAAGDSLLACVWEQVILEHERKAWVKHVLAPTGCSIENYLQDSLPNGIY